MRSRPALLLPAAALLACGGEGPTDVAPVATTIRLDQPSLALDDGASATLGATVLDQHGAPIPGMRATWHAVDTALVAVAADGRLTTRYPGLARVVASAGSASGMLRDTVRVTVRPVATTLAVTSGDAQAGVATLALAAPTVLRVTDRHGIGVGGATIRLETGDGRFEPAVVTTDFSGSAAVLWTLAPRGGALAATARVDGSPAITPVPLSARATVASAPVIEMLRLIDQEIANSLTDMERAIPNSAPQYAPFAEAKMAMLRQPGFKAGVLGGARWVEGSFRSIDERTVPIASVFALDSMREESRDAVAAIAAGMPVLEGFMGTAFPAARVLAWNGFKVGSAGGGGMLHMEDRATYEARTPATRLPWESMIVHEVSHSFISNESLNQLLELYQYNLVRGATTDPATWTFTRRWTPGLETNVGVHALLDVYQLVGHDAMQRAYRAVYPMRPPYGQALSSAVQQAFVDQAPEAVKAQVAAKMASVGP